MTSLLQQLQSLPVATVWLSAAVAAAVLLVVLLAGRRFGGKRSAEELPDFSANLDQAPVIDLMNAANPRDGSERRASVRREGNTVPIFISDLRGHAKPSTGYVIDRSTGGLRIATAMQVPIGTVLSVRTQNAPETTAWVQIQVRSCVPVGDYYQLGVCFLEPPPWNVLLLFG